MLFPPRDLPNRVPDLCPLLPAWRSSLCPSLRRRCCDRISVPVTAWLSRRAARPKQRCENRHPQHPRPNDSGHHTLLLADVGSAISWNTNAALSCYPLIGRLPMSLILWLAQATAMMKKGTIRKGRPEETTRRARQIAIGFQWENETPERSPGPPRMQGLRFARGNPATSGIICA